MENNSLSPKLKWQWVSDNPLRDLLHLESGYKSEPLAVIPFYCCTTMRVESLFRLIFSINSERQSMGMPTCVPIWKKPSLRSSLSEHCCSRRGWWWGCGTGPAWGSSAWPHGPADCSTRISAGRLLSGLQNHPDEDFQSLPIHKLCFQRHYLSGANKLCCYRPVCKNAEALFDKQEW